MPAILRKTVTAVFESRRESLQAIGWQVYSTTWSPPTDLYETEENLILQVELAGMSEENINVVLEDSRLMISGHRPVTGERRAYHKMEIAYGKFEVAVDIPMQVDLDKTTAEYKDGFLTIVLRKIQQKPSKVKE